MLDCKGFLFWSVFLLSMAGFYSTPGLLGFQKPVDFQSLDVYPEFVHYANRVKPGEFGGSYHVFPSTVYVMTDDDEVSTQLTPLGASTLGIFKRFEVTGETRIGGNVSVGGDADIKSLALDGVLETSRINGDLEGVEPSSKRLLGLGAVNCAAVQMDCTGSCTSSGPDSICKYVFGSTFWALGVSCDGVDKATGSQGSCTPGITDVNDDNYSNDICEIEGLNDSLGGLCGGVSDNFDDALITCCSTEPKPFIPQSP